MAAREAHGIRYQSMNQSRTAGMYLHLHGYRKESAKSAGNGSPLGALGVAGGNSELCGCKRERKG